MGVDGTIVVGGGLGGLLAATELERRGVEVQVFDAASDPGGIARSITIDGFTLEPAVGTVLLPHPHLTPIFDHAGVATTPAATSRRRYLYTRSRLVPVGPSPALVAAPILGSRAKIRALAEPFIRRKPGNDESLLAMLSRRLGAGAGELAAHAMASGVFAGDPGRLSASAAFPRLPTLEAEAGSLFGGALRLRRRSAPALRPGTHVPVGGMAAMADRLAAALGSRYHREALVSSVRRERESWRVDVGELSFARNIVLAVGPVLAAQLLASEARFDVRDQRSAVDVVWLGGPHTSFPLPDGLGYISGQDTGFIGLGCLFESSFAPSLAPAGMSLVKVIAGGALHPEVASWSDDDVVARVIAEVAEALGVRPTITFRHIVRHRPGIPQYTIGHDKWLADMEGRLGALDGVYLTGWNYRGIGIARLATEAVRIAAAIVDDATMGTG